MTVSGLQSTYRERAPAGVDSIARSGGQPDLLRAVIAQHGGVIDWTVDSAGWVVTLYLPEERTFCGGRLEDGLAACLAWLLQLERESRLVLT